jgi:hypothetical protein
LDRVLGRQGVQLMDCAKWHMEAALACQQHQHSDSPVLQLWGPGCGVWHAASKGKRGRDTEDSRIMRPMAVLNLRGVLVQGPPGSVLPCIYLVSEPLCWSPWPSFPSPGGQGSSARPRQMRVFPPAPSTPSCFLHGWYHVNKRIESFHFSRRQAKTTGYCSLQVLHAIFNDF